MLSPPRVRLYLLLFWPLTFNRFEELTDFHPSTWSSLAKYLVHEVSPLVSHIDFALDWVSVHAGSVLYRQGEESDAIYLVLHGRLRAVSVVGDKGPQMYVICSLYMSINMCEYVGFNM